MRFLDSSSAPIVVSFHTPDEYYREAAARLRNDCESLGLEHDIVQIEKGPDEDWLAICRRKVPFYLAMQRKHMRPILWLDADTRIARPLEALHGATCDIAGFLRGTRYLRDFDPLAAPRFFAPYALFFNCTSRARAFLELMNALETSSTVAASDDFFLQEAWRTHEQQLSVMVLPPELVGSTWPLEGSEALYLGISGNASVHKQHAEQHPVPLFEASRRKAVLLYEAARARRAGDNAVALCLYRRALEAGERDDALAAKIERLMRRMGLLPEADEFIKRYRGSES